MMLKTEMHLGHAVDPICYRAVMYGVLHLRAGIKACQSDGNTSNMIMVTISQNLSAEVASTD